MRGACVRKCNVKSRPTLQLPLHTCARSVPRGSVDLGRRVRAIIFSGWALKYVDTTPGFLALWLLQGLNRGHFASTYPVLVPQGLWPMMSGDPFPVSIVVYLVGLRARFPIAPGFDSRWGPRIGDGMTLLPSSEAFHPKVSGSSHQYGCRTGGG